MISDWLLVNWTSALKKNKILKYHFLPYSKINFSWIVDLNFRVKNINLLEAA